MAKIKYLGSADRMTLRAGEDFDGRLQGDAVLTSDVVFNKSNHWLVDSEQAGMHPEFVSLLLENDADRFSDVTNETRIPSSVHEQMFLGHKTGDAPVAPTPESDAEVPAGANAEQAEPSGEQAEAEPASSRSNKRDQ